MFSYSEFFQGIKEDWKLELVDIFKWMDDEQDGSISAEKAKEALELVGILDTEKLTEHQKTVTLQQFIDFVGNERAVIALDNQKRWTYIFNLITGGNKAIDINILKKFFAYFEQRPKDMYCDDFIDEFDRYYLEKTEITLEDWLSFCKLHRVPF